MRLAVFSLFFAILVLSGIGKSNSKTLTDADVRQYISNPIFDNLWFGLYSTDDEKYGWWNGNEYHEGDYWVFEEASEMWILDQIEDDIEILEGNDEELKQIAQDEIVELESEKLALEEKLKILLLPTDPNDDKNLILEIRAGTGGDEAALFAADLFRIYIRYAERNNWIHKVMDSSDTGIGGIKEAIVSIQGNGAFGMLKYESGVHRVQRVPKTETSGRVHTSAATIAVLPEAEDVDIEVNEGDLIAILDAGAYGFSMSSQYNSRPRPAEVLVHQGQSRLIRRAETFEDLAQFFVDFN